MTGAVDTGRRRADRARQVADLLRGEILHGRFRGGQLPLETELVPSIEDRLRLECDVLVVGGGTAGTMAAISAAEHGARVLLLEKAHVRHSGALAMGMDGVNNAVIPGKATPEDYVAEITRANDGAARGAVPPWAGFHLLGGGASA